MIHVDFQPEPADFASKVKAKGDAFLKQNPNPKTWDNREYWTEALDDLRLAYKGICAYACHWIPPDVGNSSVEHFAPKSKYPAKAYEWSNYRLVSARLNGRKGNFEDVLDPFLVASDWFQLKLPEMRVIPNGTLPTADKDKVKSTINRLKLNDDKTCQDARFDYLLQFCRNRITFEHLEERAPFIAYELIRQNLKDTICSFIPARFLV